MSAMAEKGSEYKNKANDQQLDLSINEYSDSSDDKEEVNIYSKDQIVKN